MYLASRLTDSTQRHTRDTRLPWSLLVLSVLGILLPQTLSAQNSGSIGRSNIGSDATVVLHALPPVGVAEQDSLYPEEIGEQGGFSYLLQRIPKEAAKPISPLPVPDLTLFDLPILFNFRTQEAIRTLQYTDQAVFSTWLNRVNRYKPMVQSILTREGLPKDLLYVALIESGFNPRSFSPEGTSGLWQMTLATADQYGLDRTALVDERLDPEKSTRIMAQRFKALFNRFEDWNLVIAAHHTDPEIVAAAIKEQGTRDVWQLGLPRNTDWFLSLVMAASIIGKNPTAYGFELTSSAPVIFETAPVGQPTPLQVVADGIQIPVDKLKLLNPELRNWKIPAGYLLKIPLGTQPQYRRWAGLPPLSPVLADLMAYKVRRGDTITSVGRRFGVEPEEIALENNLLVKSKLKKGRVLFVPIYNRTTATNTPASVRPEPSPPVSSTADQQEAAAEDGDDTPQSQTKYRVKRGDTLAAIGRRYGVSVSDLQRWNKLKKSGAILIGQNLVILKPVGKGVAAKKISVPKTPQASDGKTILYTVKRGDTLWDIARQFNVTMGAILGANNLRKRPAIHPGDRLKIIQPTVN